MAYCLALPEADELIYGFIRGDLALFPGSGPRPARPRHPPARTRTRRAAARRPSGHPARPEARRPPAQAERRPDGGSNLEKFIRENREIFRQVDGSPKSFLVRWVMLHLMERAQARERGHRVVHEFFADHPEFRERLRVPGHEALRPEPTVAREFTALGPLRGSRAKGHASSRTAGSASATLPNEANPHGCRVRGAASAIGANPVIKMATRIQDRR